MYFLASFAHGGGHIDTVMADKISVEVMGWGFQENCIRGLDSAGTYTFCMSLILELGCDDYCWSSNIATMRKRPSKFQRP